MVDHDNSGESGKLLLDLKSDGGAVQEYKHGSGALLEAARETFYVHYYILLIAVAKTNVTFQNQRL